MAPEQLQGSDLTPAVDCWALGVTLYDAVTGHNPFDRSTTVATFHAILMGDLPPAPCGPPLAEVIGGLLVRDPAQRMTTERARASLTGAAPPLRPADPSVPVPFAAPPSVPPPGPTAPGGAWSMGPGGTAVATSPAGLPGQPAGQSPRRRRGVLIGAGAVVVAVVVVVIAVTALHGSGGNPPAESGSSGSATVTTSTAGTASSAATDTPASSAPASATSASAASGPGAVPQAYLGQWSGTITDNSGIEGPQTAKLKLTGGAVNSIVGTSSYTNGPCAYNLLLISSSGSEVELQEQVTSGECLADYAIVKLNAGSSPRTST